MSDDLKLTPELREKLEKALLGAFDRSGLERLARGILDIELEHIAVGPLRDVVTRFLEEVLRHGQLRKLARRAHLANPTHPGLNEAIDELMRRPFKTEQVASLRRILQESGLDWELLKRESESCVPDTYTSEELDTLQDESERLAGLLDMLSAFGERPSEKRSFPLFEFVRCLRDCPAASDVTNRLEDWFRRTAVVLKKNPATIEEQCYRRFGKLYLLVKIERVSAEGFQVEAWLADNQNPFPRAIFKDERSRKFGELKDVPRLLLKDPKVLAPLKGLDMSNLTIEFLLPWELLLDPLLAVESWEDGAGTSIGTQCQVVVRSLERAYVEVRPSLDAELEGLPPITSVHWKTKWRTLADAPPSELKPVWVHQAGDHQGRGFMQKISKPEVVCLALTMTPPERSEAALRELIHRCLMRGMPAALWARAPRCVEAAEVRALFEELAKDLRGLPSKVLQARGESPAEDEGHLGNHITLLWDDPDRLPEDARPGSDYSVPVAAGVKG